jgi:hypothetical protein
MLSCGYLLALISPLPEFRQAPGEGLNEKSRQQINSPSILAGQNQRLYSLAHIF